MSANINLDLNSVRTALPAAGHKLLKYAGFLFFLLLALVYGFMILQINTLGGAQPDPADITSAQVASPHVDTDVANHLEALKDNSVNVQTLFNDSRSNPFNE